MNNLIQTIQLLADSINLVDNKFYKWKEQLNAVVANAGSWTQEPICEKTDIDAWYETNTSHQPAGNPVRIQETGMELNFAKGYLFSDMAKTKRRKKLLSKILRRRRKQNKYQNKDEMIKSQYLLYQNLYEENEKSEIPILFERSRWWSTRLKSWVVIFKNVLTNKCRGFVHKDELELKSLLYTNTALASKAWTIEAEERALGLLKTYVTEEQYKSWYLTGLLLEKSKRSGVTYLFRKLRPTLALKYNGKDVHFLAALCHHPVAFYQVSWAGALCPTDDLISHLLLMRGDEARFWKKSSQHQRSAIQADF